MSSELPSISVISNALNYHDNNKEKYSELINNISYYKRVQTESLVQNVTYTFYDKNDNELFTSRVELIGQYHINKKNNQNNQNNNNTSSDDSTNNIDNIINNENINTDTRSWAWGWGIPIANKHFTNIIKRVFLYGTDINVSIGGKFNNDNLLLKSELITSRFYVSNDTQVDIHCALASYLANVPFIISFANIGNFDKDDESKFIYTKYDKNSEYNGVVYYMYVLDTPTIA